MEVATTSTSSMPIGAMRESLGMASLSQNDGALVVMEGPPIESPEHGHFIIAFFEYSF